MEKTIQAIQSVKENGESVQYYIRDLNTWENEMKRKEAALKSESKQEIPPVRSRVKREKYLKNKKKNKKNSPSTQNKSWDNIDGNNSSEDMDLSEVGPLSLSLDGKQSEVIKQMKLKEEAQLQKERGNKFVKVERWDDAIACYNRAIQLVKDDAIYYANRGLCYLKKDSLHQAEADCTEALRLDPTYVKAFQRRASAREKLGSLRAASNDLLEVLKLEPHNSAARKQLDCIRQRMGTKGRKAKSSPSNPQQPSPIGSPAALSPKDIPSQPTTKPVEKPPSKILGVPAASQIQPDIQPTPIKKVEATSELANWKDGVGEDILVIKPVKKPPHLRSKRALKQIPIKEIPLGSTTEVKPRVLIEEISDDQASGDNKMMVDEDKEKTIIEEIKEEKMLVEESKEDKIIIEEKKEDKLATGDNNDVDSKKIEERMETEKQKGDIIKELKTSDIQIKEIASQMADIQICEEKNLKNAANTKKRDMVPPANSVQFMSEWRNLKGDDASRSDYLCLLEPNRIPMVFANALESDVLSEIIRVLHEYRHKFNDHLTAYLKGFARVKRLSALVMFLPTKDKEILNQLLVHCKTTENCSDEDIAELKMKYEL